MDGFVFCSVLCEEMHEIGIDVEFCCSLLQDKYNCASCQGIDDEFDDEVDSDDCKDEDEGVGESAELIYGRSIVEEEAEGSHEENRIQQGCAGRTDKSRKIAFFILDFDSIMDKSRKKSYEHSGNKAHTDQTGPIPESCYFTLCDAALKQQCCCIHTEYSLQNGNESPNRSGKKPHPRAEDTGDDADWYSHQRNRQGSCLDRSNWSKTK